MKNREVISLIVWIASGVAICAASASMRLGSLSQPGPGLFPFLIGCAIIVISFPQLIIQSLKRTTHERFFESFAGVKSVIMIFLLLSFYALFLSHLGFVFCTFFFFVAIFKTLGRKSWLYAIFTSLIVSFLSHTVFVTWLKVNLPAGPLGI